MASLSEELQGVMREAERAQQLADDSLHSAAIDSFYTAACQLSYLVDLHVEKGSLLEQVCQHLVATYQRRLTVMQSKVTAAEEGHWVQLEHPAGHGQVATSSRASATTATTQFTGRLPTAPALQASMLAAGTCGMQSSYINVTAPAPDSEAGDDTQVSCGDPQAAIELLRMCQRSVSGTLDDVVGLEEVKEELEEAIFLPMQHPYLFKGIRQPAKTFLLYGPPGTGKTMLVEKVAAEAGLNLLAVSPSMILSKWSGDSEKAISQVFELARTMQPALLFMDEIDSIGQSRDGNTDPGSRRLLTELLIQFNRLTDEEGIYIFAATNRMQDCDPALLRRFSRRIEVPLPKQQERQAFFQAVSDKPELDAALSAQELLRLAEQTNGYSGSDLAAVCRLAAMAPVRELFQQQRQLRKGCKRRRLCGGDQSGNAVHAANSGQGSGPLRGLAMQSMNGSDQRQRVDNGAEEASFQQVQAMQDAHVQGYSPEPQDHVPAAEPMHQEQPPDKSPIGSNTGVNEQLQVRQLRYADFEAALQKVKPATADAQLPG